MAESLFKAKKNINGIGFYAIIEITANVNDNPRFLEIEFDKTHVEEEWYYAIEFGVKYFFEHFSKEHRNGLSVYVKNLHTMLEDSSAVTVFFVTVKCLCQALDYSLDLVSLDETSGLINMKK